jgi:hypothetical protein
MTDTAMDNKVNNKKFSFIQKKIEVPVEITDDNGNTRYFILRKANGTAVKNFRNVILSGAKVQNDKIVGFGNLADAEPVLLANCMRELVFDANGQRVGDKPVDVATVLSWDHDVIKELHDEVKKISNLSDVTGVDLNPEEKVKRLNKELAEAMVELAEWQKNEATRKNS